jgi:hypothetical protein
MAAVLGFLTTGIFALFGFSPLASLWFEKVSGLPPDLAAFVRTPVQILVLMPPLWMVLIFQRSVLVNVRRTAAITWATAFDFALIVAVMLINIRFLESTGVLAAVIALIIGRLGAVSCLFPPFLKALRNSSQRSLPR